MLTLVLVTAGAFPTEGSAGPSVEIMSPKDGALLLENTVNVTGSSTGTDAAWVQNEEVDFTGGTLDNVVVNPGGSVQLEGPGLFGNYTSVAFDTTSTAPSLRLVLWTANVTPEGNLTVQIRSGAEADLSDGSAWEPVWNGQYVGFGAARRYLQYKVAMSTNDPSQRPSLLNIQIGYRIEIQKVELSIDQKATWHLANGTERWYIIVTLPDDTLVIHVRATDTAGLTKVSSVSVYVDASPPVGSISLDGGARFTRSRTVNLSATATDNNQVTWIILGERPDHFGCTWQVYPPPREYSLSPGDGPKTVYARFRNVLGVESALVNASIWLDTAPPTGSVIIGGGAAYARSGVVNLTLAASDATGVTDMKVGAGSDLNGSAWEPFRTESLFDLGPVDGIRTVYAAFRDAAGSVSETENDMIFLDRQPPVTGLLINNGTMYTRIRTVTLTLNATDNDRVAAMQAGEGAGYESAQFMPYTSTRSWQLSAGDGTKTLFARAMDAAGNIGPPARAEITLDDQAPTAQVLPLPAVLVEPIFAVRWEGTDQVGRVRSYDVQFSKDSGAWTDWLLNTNLTQALFSGEDTHRYSFRVSAADMAGNRGDYSWNISNSILVDLPGAVVTIKGPGPGTVLGNPVTMRGTAASTNASRTISLVEVRIDSGEWSRAAGTQNWSYTFDSTRLSNGWHTLSARSFDGTKYSRPSSIEFQVNNVSPTGGSFGTVICVVLALAIGLVVVAVVFSYLTKASSGPAPPQRVGSFGLPAPGPGHSQGQLYTDRTGRLSRYPVADSPYYWPRPTGPGTSCPGPGATRVYSPGYDAQAAAGTLAPPEEGWAMPPQPVVDHDREAILAGSSEVLEVEEATEARADETLRPEVLEVEEASSEGALDVIYMGAQGPTEPPQEAAPAPEYQPGDLTGPAPDSSSPDRNARVMKALLIMPRGVPMPLLGITMSELAGMILQGARQKTPGGSPVVRLKGKWYHADETNLKEFMIEYKP